MQLNSAWVVTDPEKDSTLADICFEVTLPEGLHRQFLGGLSMRQNPVLFTERAEAEADARVRLVAMQAARAIADGAPRHEMKTAARVTILDPRGKVLLDLPLS